MGNLYIVKVEVEHPPVFISKANLNLNFIILWFLIKLSNRVLFRQSCYAMSVLPFSIE